MKMTKRIFATLLAVLMAFSMLPITALADDTADLQAAITAYETKMDGTAYTNMKAAYDAYVTACAVYYGTNTSVTAAAAASDLTTKTAAMTAYSAYSGTKDVYFGSLAKTDSIQGYSNILYAYGEAGVTGIANSGDNYAEVGRQKTGGFMGIGNYNYRVYYKSFAPTNIVMYYNGNLDDLYYPVGVEVYANNDKLRTVDYIDVNDSNIGFKEYWRGYQQGWDNTYGFNYATIMSGGSASDSEKTYDGTCGLGYSSSNTLSHTLSKDGASKNRFWINKAYITKLNSDNTLTKSSINFRLHVTDTDINVGSNPAPTTVNSNIYVVNYYQVTQAIANNNGELDDVASYKKGGLSTLLAKYDDATSFDITSYFTSATESNAGTCATNAEAGAKAVANGLNNCAAPTKDTYTVTFKNAAGTTVDSKNVAAGSTVGTLPANTAAAHVANTNTHNVYTWNATAATDVEYDMVVTETAAAEACTFTAGAHTDATDALNGYTTYTCACGNSYKSYDALNFDAYTAAVADYNTTINAADYENAYTAASRADYEAAVETAKLTAAQMADETLAPKVIADAAQAITDAKDELAVQEFTVTFVKADSTSTSADFAYGTSAAAVEAAAPALPENYYDAEKHYSYAWNTAFADVTAAATYTQVETAEEHVFTQSHTAATAEKNGFTTFTCDCGKTYDVYDTQDFTAYDAALNEFATIVNAEDYETKYTAESRTDYEAAVEAAKLTAAQIADETLAPKVIADAAQAIIDAKALLVEIVEEPEDTYNLTITDDIDINFNIDTEYQDAEDGYITVEYIAINENEISTTTTTDTIDATGTQTSISMAAIPAQLAEPYVITVYNKDGDKIREFEQSVADYCNAVINSTDPAVTEKDKEVAKGLLDYGAAASDYFNYTDISETDNYAVSHAADYDAYAAALDINDIRAKATVEYTEGVDKSGAALKVTGISYLALTEPEFRFYVSQTNDVWCYYTDLGIEGEGLTAEWAKTESGNCVIVKGLKASDFGKDFTLTIGTTTLKYNGYAFLYSILRTDTSYEAPANLKDLAKGVYRYAAACADKFNA